MRKIYSLVLMTAMLFVGANAWAQTTLTLGTAESGATYQTLQAAIDAAAAGQTTQINMISPLSTNATAWLGTEKVTDAPKHIILDLQGYTYEYTGTKNIAIALTHGTLEIKSTGTNVGIIQTGSATDELIRVYGTYEKINAKTETPFAHLIVRENVTLQSTKKNVLSVDVLRPGQAKLFGKLDSDFKYACDFFYNNSSSTSGWGVANGVRLDIYGNVTSTVKYALKVNGCIRYGKDYLEADGVTPKTGYPYLRDNYAPKYVNGANTGTYTITTSDGDYSPYIYVAPTGRLATNDTRSEAVAAYSSGYGRWRIEGYCGGSTGLYIKSGVIEVHDAEIVSNNTEPHNTPDGKGSGVDAGGSAVVVESNATYSGNISVTISGDSRIEGASGYAIEETKTTAPTSEVTGVEIQGGTIVGGDKGAIIITDEAKDSVAVVGGNFEGDIKVKEASGDTATAQVVDASDLIPPTTTMHTTEVVIDGKTTVVVSEGVAPTTAETKTSWNDIAGFTSGSNAKWTGTGETDGVGTISGLVTLGELQILSATALTGAGQQKLTITSTGELHVNHLMMNQYAQIVVEAGGKLIVEGEQGILAPSVDNITLKASETAQATFLFNPAVSSNRHPNATVEFASRGKFVDPTIRYNWQRFCIPTENCPKAQVSDNSAEKERYNPSNPIFTQIYQWNYGDNEWERIDQGDYVLERFRMYNMTNSSKNGDVTYQFKGGLCGNVNDKLEFAMGYNFFGNSYNAPMDVETLLGALTDSRISKTIYLWLVNDQRYQSYPADYVGTILWEGANQVPSMQTFVFQQLTAGDVNVSVNYEDLVWNTRNKVYAAPTRQNFNSEAFRINISDAKNHKDQVTFVIDDKYTNDFDNGGDANKLMADDMINIYATTENGMQSFVASNDVLGTMLSLQTKEEENYMITFSCVTSEAYALRDTQTGIVTNISDGSVYCFSTIANSTIENRFEIVARQEMPTELETIDNKELNNGGIYTITGQYVGEADSWFSLPAGMYIMNGQKVIK